MTPPKSENQETPPQRIAALPRKLNAVGDNPKVSQTFGWAPAAWGIGLLIFSIYAFITDTPNPDADEKIARVSITALAVALLAFEFWRRINSRVFVRFATSNSIAIYKRGILERVIPIPKIGLFFWNGMNTFRMILPISVITIVLGVLATPGGIKFSTADRVLIGTISLCCAALLASVIWTRLFSRVILLPRSNNRGFARSLVRKKDATKLLNG